MTESQTARFLSKIAHDPDGCWRWTGALMGKGYGMFLVDGRRRAGRQPSYAHRVSYEHFVGPIPEGLQIDHLCRNRACVNPDHLEPVTNRENARRGERANRTHCPNGHPKTPENTYSYAYGRYCRPCTLERRRGA